MVTRRALDIDVNENAVELGGGHWLGRRGGAYEGNKRQGGVGAGWCLVAAWGHAATGSRGGPRPVTAGGERLAPAR
jgi:hypothetical protein